MLFNFVAKMRAKKARKAEAVRQAKLAPLQAAIKSRDTRKQHEAFRPAFEATNEALRASRDHAPNTSAATRHARATGAQS